MIDWFTVIAQVINFLILVGLLRYFLYGRVLAAIDGREEAMAARWEEAERQREQAATELEEAREKSQQFDEQREQFLAAARDEVELYREQLTAKVRSEADELQLRWSDAIHEETESFLRDLRRRTSEEVCTIARHALSDLAGASLERQMVERFLLRVGGLSEQEKQAVIGTLEDTNRVAIVQTTCKLAKDLRQMITETLHQQFLADLDVQFEQADDLLCGIALQTNAHKLAWNLRDYFASLEQELRRTLEEEAATGKPRPKQTADTGR